MDNVKLEFRQRVRNGEVHESSYRWPLMTSKIIIAVYTTHTNTYKHTHKSFIRQ